MKEDTTEVTKGTRAANSLKIVTKFLTAEAVGWPAIIAVGFIVLGGIVLLK